MCQNGRECLAYQSPGLLKTSKSTALCQRVFLERAPIPGLEMEENKEVPKNIFSMNPLYPNTP